MENEETKVIKFPKSITLTREDFRDKTAKAICKTMFESEFVKKEPLFVLMFTAEFGNLAKKLENEFFGDEEKDGE